MFLWRLVVARFNIQVCDRMYYLQTECDENDVCNVSHDNPNLA